MTKSTSGGCDQFATSPEAIDQELRTSTDRLKTNYRIDIVKWCSLINCNGCVSLDIA